MTNDACAAVLTTQYLTKTHDLTLRSLRVLAQLPLRHILIVIDEKEPDGRLHAEAAIQQMSSEFKGATITAETFAVNCFSTARRWYQPICRLFDLYPGLHAVLNFPGDLDREISPEQIGILETALGSAPPQKLVLFDYHSNDGFKQAFDSLFLLPLLRAARPELVQRIERLGHSKLRTEIFLTGREPFTKLRHNTGISWGTDPTVQLIVNSAAEDLEIQSVKLGAISDDSNTRSGAAGKTQQIVRMGHQILNDATIASAVNRRGQPAATFDELERLAGNIHSEIQRCLRRGELLTAELDEPAIGGLTARIRLATHVIGGTPSATENRPSTLQRIADTIVELAGVACAAHASLLVLVQPSTGRDYSRQECSILRDQWEAEARRLNELGQYRMIEVVFDPEHTQAEPPTLAWKILHQHAFDPNDSADGLLYFDVNLIGWERPHLRLVRPGFQKMLLALQRGTDLVLGDYRPVPPISAPDRAESAECKRFIETAVRHMLLDAFPDLFAGWRLFAALERPRTEFYALSRRLHCHLGTGGQAPYDYGLYMLVAARLLGLCVERVPLGDLPETSSYNSAKVVGQINRARFQIDAMRNFRPMLNPLNPKLSAAGLEASFAPFKGYSLVFNNDRTSYVVKDGLLHVHGSGSSNPTFYGTLFEALSELDLTWLRTRFSLCTLPEGSAHVTVLDGNNPDNLAGIRSEDLDGIKDFIAQLPGSMHGAEDVLPEFYGSPLGLQEWPIDFVFDELTIWGGSALVAKLKPATDQSRETLARLQVERKLFAERHPRFGLRPQSLVPHASLAYFADPRLGNLAKMYLPDWSAAFAKRLGDIRLSFHTIGLHAFTDMATFFKLPER